MDILFVLPTVTSNETIFLGVCPLLLTKLNDKMVVTADPSVLRGIPEFFETNLGECLQARTESLGIC
jgi:hypothetical protein